MTRARDLAAFVSNADGDIKFDTDTLFIDSSTNRVGIGTTSPAKELSISSATDPTIRITDTTNTVNLELLSGNSEAYIGTQSNHSLLFTSNNTERMRIKENGDVGIGVNDPDANLDISGGSNKLGILRVVQRASGAAAYGLDVGLDPTLGDPVFSRIVNDTVTESFRIQRSSGKVGIGTSAPDTPLHVEGASGSQFVVEATSGQFAQQDFKIAGAQKGAIWTDDGTDLMGYYVGSGWGKNFYTNGAERMRIDSGGRVMIATTDDLEGTLNVQNKGGDYCIALRDSAVNSAYMLFRNSANTATGSILRSGTSTSFNTTSDYRLKENIVDISNGIERVKQLAPKRFNFIEEPDRTVDGFLAHEAQAVVAEAVHGTKDAMKDEKYEVSAATGDVYTPATEEADEVIHSSNVEQPETLEKGQIWRETTAAEMGTRRVPDMQGIDQAKLVPLLTAALQEAIAKIETLETKVAALEAE